MPEEMTTIWVSKVTKKRLDELGAFKETYDKVLKRIIDVFEETVEDHSLPET